MDLFLEEIKSPRLLQVARPGDRYCLYRCAKSVGTVDNLHDNSETEAHALKRLIKMPHLHGIATYAIIVACLCSDQLLERIL